jgi:hypothetical protein
MDNQDNKLGGRSEFISYIIIPHYYNKFVLKTTWKQARIETLKVHEMEQSY